MKLAEDTICRLENARSLASQVNRHGDAVAIYADLLVREPGCIEAWLELGNLLKRTKQYDLALSCFQRVMHLSTVLAEPYLNSAEIFEDRGLSDEARSYYDKALERSGDFGIAIQAATLIPVIPQNSDTIEAVRKQIFENLRHLNPDEFTVGDPLKFGRIFFYLAYHGYNDKPFQEQLAALYRTAYPCLSWIAPHCTKNEPWSGSRKVRLAFVSRFFHNHTIAKLNRGLITHISRQNFEVHVFHLGSIDQMSDLIKKSADHFSCCCGTLADIRNTIAAWEPDIVYYCDIGMEPLTYFLAFARLAPFQCVTWGHPVTSGIATIDAFISHESCELGSPQEQYTEQLFCLRRERSLTYFYRPELPVMNKTRSDFSLPPVGHIYACPQSIFKIHPEFDALLAGIMREDPEGHLVFIQGTIPEHEQMLRQRLSKLIPDHAERITFVPRMSEDEYLNLISLSDVLLDPIHFGGGNSSAEAFAIGTPIVTLPSPYLRGRLTYTWYRKMGFLECVAESPEEYVKLAVRLGTDKAFHSHAQNTIHKRSHHIYEDRGVVVEIEAFLMQAVREIRKSP